MPAQIPNNPALKKKGLEGPVRVIIPQIIIIVIINGGIILLGIHLGSRAKPRQGEFYVFGYCLKTPTRGAPKSSQSTLASW